VRRRIPFVPKVPEWSPDDPATCERCGVTIRSGDGRTASNGKPPNQSDTAFMRELKARWGGCIARVPCEAPR
jgi:hypothetical protein